MSDTAAAKAVRVGIIGCGRILPAHLDGLRRLKERGAAEFSVTALCARKREDAEMFRKRGEGPPPRQPVLAANDPLAVPHLYVSDFQAEPLPDVFTDYRELIEADVADAFIVTTSLDWTHYLGQPRIIGWPAGDARWRWSSTTSSALSLLEARRRLMAGKGCVTWLSPMR